jgi:Uma2 family endonuclease
MTRAIRPHQPLSVEEFFELEEASDVRHEYIDGQVYALAGVSARHDDIVMNLVLALGPAARRRGCRINSGELMLRLSERRYYYPDLAVYCPPFQSGERHRQNPCVVIEVLSPSTVGIDRREKLFAYRGIERLETYLIVHQDEFHVERHWRDESGAWQQDEVIDDGTVPIRCLDTQIQLSEIYDGLEPIEREREEWE